MEYLFCQPTTSTVFLMVSDNFAVSLLPVRHRKAQFSCTHGAAKCGSPHAQALAYEQQVSDYNHAQDASKMANVAARFGWQEEQGTY